jgi:hypothetical protein
MWNPEVCVCIVVLEYRSGQSENLEGDITFRFISVKMQSSVPGIRLFFSHP